MLVVSILYQRLHETFWKCGVRLSSRLLCCWMLLPRTVSCKHSGQWFCYGSDLWLFGRRICQGGSRCTLLVLCGWSVRSRSAMASWGWTRCLLLSLVVWSLAASLSARWLSARAVFVAFSLPSLRRCFARCFPCSRFLGWRCFSGSCCLFCVLFLFSVSCFHTNGWDSAIAY